MSTKNRIVFATLALLMSAVVLAAYAAHNEQPNPSQQNQNQAIQDQPNTTPPSTYQPGTTQPGRPQPGTQPGTAQPMPYRVNRIPGSAARVKRESSISRGSRTSTCL